MSKILAELLGTMVLIIFGSGVVGNVVLKGSKGENSGWIVISIAWGLAVTIAIYAVGGISGAHINPAVTLGLASIGEFPWAEVPMYILAQIAGAFIGGTIVYVHYLPHWRETSDAGLKRAVFCTDPAIPSRWANLLSEIIGTGVLLMGLLTIGVNEFSQGLNPLVVGLLIVAIGLSLGGTTGYAINPARDLGPRLAHFILPIHRKGDSGWSYAWIPVIGPIIGGVYGSLVYRAVFKNDVSIAFWVGSAVVLGLIAMAIIEDRKKGK